MRIYVASRLRVFNEIFANGVLVCTWPSQVEVRQEGENRKTLHSDGKSHSHWVIPQRFKTTAGPLHLGRPCLPKDPVWPIRAFSVPCLVSLSLSLQQGHRSRTHNCPRACPQIRKVSVPRLPLRFDRRLHSSRQFPSVSGSKDCGVETPLYLADCGLGTPL